VGDARGTDGVTETADPWWRRHLVALILSAFGLLLVVIVLIQLLDRGDVRQWLSELDPVWTYFTCFLFVALDAVIPIFPGETTLSAASTMAANGDLELRYVMLAGALGAIVGDSCLFWIARTNGKKVAPRLDEALENDKVRAGWEMLNASPGVLIVAGRYVPGLRFAVNATMGLSEISYRRFLGWSILGGTLWSVYTCALAYRVATTLSGYPLASIVISSLVTSAAIAALFVYYRHKRRGADPATAIELPEVS
jgi:membrane-associated protein